MIVKVIFFTIVQKDLKTRITKRYSVNDALCDPLTSDYFLITISTGASGFKPCS